MSAPSWLSSPERKAQEAPQTVRAEPTTNAVPGGPSYGSMSRYWPGGHTAKDVLELISLLRAEILPILGDTAADEAFRLLGDFETAILDHEKHGANWLNKHREELLGHLKQTGAFSWLTDYSVGRILEGDELASLVANLFGVAAPGRVDIDRNVVVF